MICLESKQIICTICTPCFCFILFIFLLNAPFGEGPERSPFHHFFGNNIDGIADADEYEEEEESRNKWPHQDRKPNVHVRTGIGWAIFGSLHEVGHFLFYVFCFMFFVLSVSFCGDRVGIVQKNKAPVLAALKNL